MKKVSVLLTSLFLLLVIASGCVYHSPRHDHGYHRGYRVPPPPRPIVVRPAPPPRVVHKHHGRRYVHPKERRSNRHYRNDSRYGYRGRK